MKKALLAFILFLLFIPLSVRAFGVFNKTITVNFNHEGCEVDANKEVVIQLFADGEKVEDGEHILNKANNYTYVYDNLEVFHSNTNKEIKYEVKILEDGIYRMIDSDNYSYAKKHVDKWVQVLPEDIKPGHTYVITAENTLYEFNGLPQVIYLRGDVKAEEAIIENDYVFINGKPSYYSLNEVPKNNTEWKVEAVPTDDPNYNEFKDYLVFVNEGGNKLTLTGYIQDDDRVNFIFKYSGKNGFITDENALYTNKVQIIPSENSRGKFYITSRNLFEAPLDKYNRTEYLAVNGNNYYATSHKSSAGLFKAYEYIEADVQVAVNVTVKETMCATDSVVLNKESEVKRNIKLNLDCSQCESKKEEGVTLQLFADGKKVKNEEVKLNNKTGFEYTYEDLPVFHDGSDTQINYEVKALINGNYYTLPQKNVSYKKEEISKWVQVFPTDIKPGHTYTLTTNNRLYATEGGSRFVYLRGDVKAEEALVIQEYNIIDGKEYFYVLNDEPAENTLWEVTEVPSNDPDYNEFKDYLMFVNEGGKKLTLTGYIQNDDNVNFIFKYSGKNGFITDENALYTNKVMVIPANDQYGSFYIASRNLFDEPNNMIQYIKLNSSNNYQATSKIDSAAKFKAFEYVEKETLVAGEMIITPSLCEVLELANNVNPNTGSKIIMVISVMFISGAVIYALTNQRRKTLINKAR